MGSVLFIVGLPGSGNSTLANQMSKEDGRIIIDDPKDFKKEVVPFLDKDIIVTDPTLCFEESRNSAAKKLKEFNPDLKLDWIYFENDPEQCLLNVKSRNDGRNV